MAEVLPVSVENQVNNEIRSVADVGHRRANRDVFYQGSPPGKLISVEQECALLYEVVENKHVDQVLQAFTHVQTTIRKVALALGLEEFSRELQQIHHPAEKEYPSFAFV